MRLIIRVPLINGVSLWLFLLFLSGLLLAEEAKPEIISKANFIIYSPLLRLPEKSLLKQGKIELSTSQSNLKTMALGMLAKGSSDSTHEAPLISVDNIKALNHKSRPLDSYQLDFELNLIKSSKVLKGNMKYFVPSSGSDSIEVITFPTTEGSSLGDYVFVYSDSFDPMNSISILSPITKKCRELPYVSGEDPILLSGMSIYDLLPGISKNYVYKGVERTSLLVPIDTNEFRSEDVQLLKQESSSPLSRRPASLIHINVRNGLPYQVQYILDGSRRGVVLYSWYNLANGGYLPKEIAFYEEQVDSSFLPISRLNVLSVTPITEKGTEFKKEFDKDCAVH